MFHSRGSPLLLHALVAAAFAPDGLSSPFHVTISSQLPSACWVAVTDFPATIPLPVMFSRRALEPCLADPIGDVYCQAQLCQYPRPRPSSTHWNRASPTPSALSFAKCTGTVLHRPCQRSPWLNLLVPCLTDPVSALSRRLLWNRRGFPRRDAGCVWQSNSPRINATPHNARARMCHPVCRTQLVRVRLLVSPTPRCLADPMRHLQKRGENKRPGGRMRPSSSAVISRVCALTPVQRRRLTALPKCGCQP